MSPEYIFIYTTYEIRYTRPRAESTGRLRTMDRNMNTFQRHYDQLNDEQKKVVDRIDGALLVLAGPGTGKTQLLSVRAANIIRQEKADPENILILTFTNAAAREMRERLASIIGHDGYNVEVETFHSFANSIVLESEGAIKYVRDKIDISDVERVRAIQHILDSVKGVEALRPFGAPYIHLSEIRARISELKNEGISPGQLKAHLKGLEPDGITLEEKHISRLKALSLIYEKYERLKDEDRTVLFDERGRKDFDDMILIALDAFRNERQLRDQFSGQYKYVMVDEYQDTNGAQLELLFSILDPGSPNVCCVGDDDQAIYRFQGATLSNFRILKEKIPLLKTIILKDNYRSTDEVIDISRQIISQLPGNERIEVKELAARKDYENRKAEFLEFNTEEEELAYIMEEITRQAKKIRKEFSLTEEEREEPYNNIAVLVRRRVQRQKVIEAFLKAGIPYASDGKEDIRLEKRVRQMLDVLELADVNTENNEKKALTLYKVLTSDYIGASQSDIIKLIGFVNGKKSSLRAEGDAKRYKSLNLFQEFLGLFRADAKDKPEQEDSKNLWISKELELEDPYSLHKAAWAITRLLEDARTRPVHDILMRYIEDTGLYSFLLSAYDDNSVPRIRDLRALVSFINQIKQSSLSRPSYRLDDLMDEMELREIHDMPVSGELATLSQDGVRIYTAHSAKGLEFYTAFLPFCLEKRSWPSQGKADVVPLPPDIFKSKERVDEKKKLKLLNMYDEVRLFYVASSRAKANLIYTATPAEKVVVSRFLSHVDIPRRSGAPENESEFLASFLQGRTDRDPFSDTSGILKDMVARLDLTPTNLSAYISCRRKFLYNYVLRLPGKKTQHLVFGNCAHKALEDVYGHYKERKRFPSFDFFKKSFRQELEFQGVNDAIRNMCLSRLETLSDWYKRESSRPLMPYSLEKDLSVTFPGGMIFKGKFDKIEIESDGTAKVIDYKTGKPDEHVKAIQNCSDMSDHDCDDYYRQLVSYKMIFDRNESRQNNLAVSRGMLQFLEPVARSVKKYQLEKGEYRDIEIELTDKMVAELEKVIVECWRNIQALKFDKLPERDSKGRCARCEYDSICWG
ncbi:MAG: ATP-dependent DNA helicase [Candidatus Omnitrophota bacterium]|nr:ATP-dependent DNA helicase [Candidatus Omnitrophota bacterium]